MTSNQKPSQIEAYSFRPFIDLSPDEANRLSAMTRNAKDVIYVRGFLANTQMNANNFRISDNKYIEQNKGLAAGRPLNFGPKILGKNHHPNFYHDLDLEGKTPEEARQLFLQYQEWSRIGDILRIFYDKTSDRWKFYGAISHPNIVEAVQKKELELPKFVSPYFWNLNHPEETGPDIREAELFHVSFVDEPAYGPEVATIEASCHSSEGDSACAAQIYGMPAGKMQIVQSKKGMPPCMCGLMASVDNKLDSSFYVETPKRDRTNKMSDDSNSKKDNGQQEGQEGKNTNENNENQSADQLAREAALKKMAEYDKEANKGTGNIEDKKTTNDPNNPTIPVQYQDALNLAIEKDRAEQAKLNNKVIKEKDQLIEQLQAELGKIHETNREAILDKYIEKDMYKTEDEFKQRRKFYLDLAKDLKMSNDKLEELMKDHYQVKELKIDINHKGANARGKGAGSSNMNLDPFEFNNREDNGFGMLSNEGASLSDRRGLGAGITTTDSDNEEESGAAAAGAILSAF